MKNDVLAVAKSGIKKALEKSSSGHNPQIYSQKPLSDAKL